MSRQWYQDYKKMNNINTDNINFAQWLSYPGSTTKRLKKYGLSLSIDILFEEQRNIFDEDQGKCFIWYRETILYVAELPWMWAKTYIPIESYMQYKKKFDSLNNSSIGNILFAEKNTERKNMLYTNTTIDNTFPQQCHNHIGENCIIRKSNLIWQRSNITLKECFLPHKCTGNIK